MKLLRVFLLVIFVVACQQSPKLPDDVTRVLKKAGKNKVELEKVIEHYSQNRADSLKLRASIFLIANMGDKCYSHFSIKDSLNRNLHFNVLNYPDYNKMVAGWDSLESIYGPIENKLDTNIYDCQVIKSNYLINNIDLAFKAWQNFPWAKHINFKQFCEYILPYRGSNEPLENWRSYFFNKFAWVKDSVKGKDDPVEAAILINNNIKSWFSFDSRFYRQSTDQGLSEMLKNKSGRCEDMTNLALYAMRAMGIPVMSDFTPYWAKTGNNHAWNAIIDKNGKVIIFMGGLTNPGEYKLPQAKAKVYRKTFANQKNSLAEIISNREKAPHYINKPNIIDVTADYVPVADVRLKLEKTPPDSVNFAYICVFNSGKWKAIAWSKIYSDGKVNFKDMGKDIAYLPAYYINGKIIPASNPFILTNMGEIKSLKADNNKLQNVKLISTTEKITKNATDNIKHIFLKEGKEYEFFYWQNGWKSLGVKKGGKTALRFNNVPTNGLYWLVGKNSRKQERIFTIDSKGNQIWW